jgi:hypothetical protein
MSLSPWAQIHHDRIVNNLTWNLKPTTFLYTKLTLNYITTCKSLIYSMKRPQKKCQSSIMSLGGTTRNITPWFSWTHWTLKNHRIHLNEHFHKFFWIHLLSYIDFEISIISRILCISMFLIIAFKKCFRNIMIVFFLELFGQEHKFGTWFMIF